MKDYLIRDLPITHIKVDNRLINIEHLAPIKRIRLMDNGEGWILNDDGEHTPAIFYLEDVLYRLDLQGKLE